MTAQTQAPSKVHSPMGRVSYEHIWTPQPSMNGDGKLEYSLTLILDLPEVMQASNPVAFSMYQDLLRILGDAKVKKFSEAQRHVGGYKLPINIYTPHSMGAQQYADWKSSDKYQEAYDNKMTIRFASKGRPIQVSKPGPGNSVIILDHGSQEWYSGCYASVTANAFGWEARSKDGKAVVNKGVSFGLCSIMKLQDGEPFAVVHRAEEDFKGIDVSKVFGVTPEDPAAKAAGLLPGSPVQLPPGPGNPGTTGLQGI